MIRNNLLNDARILKAGAEPVNPRNTNSELFVPNTNLTEDQINVLRKCACDNYMQVAHFRGKYLEMGEKKDALARRSEDLLKTYWKSNEDLNLYVNAYNDINETLQWVQGELDEAQDELKSNLQDSKNLLTAFWAKNDEANRLNVDAENLLDAYWVTNANANHYIGENNKKALAIIKTQKLLNQANVNIAGLNQRLVEKPGLFKSIAPTALVVGGVAAYAVYNNPAAVIEYVVQPILNLLNTNVVNDEILNEILGGRLPVLLSGLAGLAGSASPFVVYFISRITLYMLPKIMWMLGKMIIKSPVMSIKLVMNMLYMIGLCITEPFKFAYRNYSKILTLIIIGYLASQNKELIGQYSPQLASIIQSLVDNGSQMADYLAPYMAMLNENLVMPAYNYAMSYLEENADKIEMIVNYLSDIATMTKDGSISIANYLMVALSQYLERLIELAKCFAYIAYMSFISMMKLSSEYAVYAWENFDIKLMADNIAENYFKLI